MAVDVMADHLAGLYSDTRLEPDHKRVQVASAHEAIRRGQASAKAFSQLAIAHEVRLLRESLANPARAYTGGAR